MKIKPRTQGQKTADTMSELEDTESPQPEDSGSWGWMADSSQPESQPEDTESPQPEDTESPQPEDSGSWGWLADSDQPESNPDNNPDKVSQLEDTDSAASFQSHCHSCGVPWESHMGIAGTCAENIKLRNEIDGLKYVVKKLEQEAKEWNLRLQDPAPIHVLSSVTMSREVSQDHGDEIAKLRRERDEARREVCEMNSIESSNESVDFLSLTPQDIADERGWDCYASDTLSQGLT